MSYGNLPPLQTLAIPTRPAPQPPVNAASFGTSLRDAYGIINNNLRGAWTILTGMTSAAGSMGFATLGPDGKLSISQRFEQAWTDVAGLPTTLALTGDAAGTAPFQAGTVSVSVALANTGVTAGTYSFARIVVDAKGRVSSASAGSIPSTSINLIGDISASGQTGSPINAGLATILPSSPLPFSVFGTYAQVVVDTTGRVRGGILAQNAAGAGTLQDVTARGATTDRALMLLNTTASTSANNGALVVSGGAAVGGALNVLGPIRTGGALVWNENSLTSGTIGVMVRTGVNAFATRALVAGNGIAISDPDGVTGFPRISMTRTIGVSLGTDLLDRDGGDGRYLRKTGPETFVGALAVAGDLTTTGTLYVSGATEIGARLRVWRDGANMFWMTTRAGSSPGADALSSALGIGSNPSTGLPTHIILRPGTSVATHNIVCRPGTTHFQSGGENASSNDLSSPIQAQQNGACYRHNGGGFDVFDTVCPMHLGTSGGTLMNLSWQNGLGPGNARVVGTITTNGFNTAYNTTSDYRLKTDIAPLLAALAQVRALNPVSYTFVADQTGTRRIGFIAHEVQQVEPTAVMGAKDAVDTAGKVVAQQLDQSKLVPVLTAAIKELDAENTALKALVAAMEARLAALEAKVP